MGLPDWDWGAGEKGLAHGQQIGTVTLIASSWAPLQSILSSWLRGWAFLLPRIREWGIPRDGACKGPAGYQLQKGGGKQACKFLWFRIL